MTKSDKSKPNQPVSANMQPDQKVACSVAPYGTQHATNFSGILARLKDATGAKSDTGFAKALGLRQSSVSSAKKREQIPPAWAVQVAEMTGASLDWLLFGKIVQPIGRINRTATPKNKGEDVQIEREWQTDSGAAEVRQGNEYRQAGESQSGPIYNDRAEDTPHDEPAPRPSISELLTKTAKVLESETVYQTALTSNIEAFYHSVVLEERINANELKTNKMFQEMRAEIQSVRNENQQLREEMQRDRDQEVTEDTG
jgi:hypothetical protein